MILLAALALSLGEARACSCVEAVIVTPLRMGRTDGVLVVPWARHAVESVELKDASGQTVRVRMRTAGIPEHRYFHFSPRASLRTDRRYEVIMRDAHGRIKNRIRLREDLVDVTRPDTVTVDSIREVVVPDGECTTAARVLEVAVEPQDHEAVFAVWVLPDGTLLGDLPAARAPDWFERMVPLDGGRVGFHIGNAGHCDNDVGAGDVMKQVYAVSSISRRGELQSPVVVSVTKE